MCELHIDVLCELYTHALCVSYMSISLVREIYRYRVCLCVSSSKFKTVKLLYFYGGFLHGDFNQIQGKFDVWLGSMSLVANVQMNLRLIKQHNTKMYEEGKG